MMAHAAPRNRNRNRRLPRWGQIFFTLVVYTLAALQSLILVLGLVYVVWTVWTALGVN